MDLKKVVQLGSLPVKSFGISWKILVSYPYSMIIKMKAIYREQGDRLYKIRGNDLIEINLESWDYGVIGIAYANKLRSPVWPNDRAKVIRKKLFDRYFKEAMGKIKLLK